MDSKGACRYFYPGTAQHAMREGPALARELSQPCCVANLRVPSTSRLSERWHRSARGVAWLPHNIILTGFVACFLWRTYYFLCLPGLDRKVRVALDWTLGLLFPRGIAELRVYTESSCERSAQDDGLAVRLQIARADVPECFRTVDSGFGAPIVASAGEAFDRDDL